MKNFKNVLFLLTIFSLWSAKSYSADFKWVVPDVSIAPGGTATVEVQATGKEFATLEMTVKLPEGISYVADSWKLGSRITKSSYDFTFDAADPKNIHIVGNDDEMNAISGTEGTVFSFDIKADESLVIGTSLTLQITASLWTTYDFSEYEETPDMDVTIKVEAAATTVDITLANASGYNSYCCDKDLDVSGVTDAKFYVVSSVTATEATLTPVTTGIPAGEGFLIEGTGTSTISVPVAATAPTATGSKLVGVTTATSIAAGNYILKSDGTSFIPCTAGTLPANKAYLPTGEVPASAKEFLMIVEDAVVTGINEVQAENSVNGPIYNLNGARVSNPQKGVYIMNGRKVIVK